MNETLITIKLVNNNAVIEMDKTIYEDKLKLELLSILLNRQRMIVDNALKKLITSE